jgi:hypothetical protein
MSYVTMPNSGTDGIIDNLKALVEKARPIYEKVRPAVSSAYQAYKGGGDTTEAVLPSSAPPPETQAPPPQSSETNWALYAGIGAAVLAIFYFRSK